MTTGNATWNVSNGGSYNTFYWLSPSYYTTTYVGSISWTPYVDENAKELEKSQRDIHDFIQGKN